MASVPKPAVLQIKGLDDELAIARLPTEWRLLGPSVHKLSVVVQVQWRRAHELPAILSTLSEIPEPPPQGLEVLKRDDGKYTLVPTALRTMSWYYDRGEGPTRYELVRAGRMSTFENYYEYGSNIIRQYQPDFDYSRSEEEANLLLSTVERINRVRESVEDLQNYLWYSDAKKRKAVPPVRYPQRDVRAAVLQDVFDLNTFQIGEILLFDPPSELEKQRKRELAAVRVAAQRGRELLHYHFGVEEWEAKVEYELFARYGSS